MCSEAILFINKSKAKSFVSLHHRNFDNRVENRNFPY